MMNSPKVSVVIPVYNAEEYLDECLTSLQKQTLQEIEIICVDDGSTDGSLEILNRYSENDERFIVIRQKNQYAGVARNNGLKNAKGEYVIFLDSDDFFSAELLEKTYTRGCETDADIVLFGGDKYNSSTGEFEKANHFFRENLVRNFDVFSRKDIPEIIMSVSSPAPWTKLFKRKFVLEEGLEFQPFPNSNDAYFTLVALCIADRIAYVNERLVHYRVGMDTNIQSKKWKAPLCFLHAYEAIYDELNRRGIFSEVEKSYVDVTISGCQFNLNTINDENARLEIYKEIMSPSFQKTGVLSHPSEYYADVHKYSQVRGVKYALEWHDKLSHRRIDHQFEKVIDTTFSHVYGSFCSYLKMNESFLTCNPEGENEKAAIKLLSDMLHSVRNDYEKLPEDEKYAYWGLPEYQRMLFELYVFEFDKKTTELNDAKKKLKKATAEKEELKKKLQQANKNNKGKTAKIKNQMVKVLTKMKNTVK